MMRSHHGVNDPCERQIAFEIAAVLGEFGPGFASGHLKPFPIKVSAIYPQEDAKAAFVAVAGSSRDRVILRPAG